MSNGDRIGPRIEGEVVHKMIVKEWPLVVNGHIEKITLPTFLQDSTGKQL